MRHASRVTLAPCSSSRVVAAYLAVGPWVLLAALLLLLVPAVRHALRAELAAAAGLRAGDRRRGRRRAGHPRRQAPDPARWRAARDAEVRGRAGDPEPDHAWSCPSTRSWRPTAAAPCTTTAGPPTPTRVRGRSASTPRSTPPGTASRSAPPSPSTPSERIVGLCGSVTGPVLHLIDPDSMEPLESLELPRRTGNTGKRPWEDLCGGAYFYLDNTDTAFVGTTRRTIVVVATEDMTVERTIDLTDVIPDDDCLVALMPDWDGAGTWWVTQDGRVGHADESGESTVRRPRRGDRQLGLGRRRGPLRRHRRGALQAPGRRRRRPRSSGGRRTTTASS